MTRFDAVTFLSDFGLVDEFVGVVHRVIHRLAPEVVVVDLTHQIPAHDVRAGALTLWRAVPWLVPGVVLAVVDPGVGTARRPVAMEVAAPDGDLYLVGPDNGLLVPAAYAAGHVRRVVVLDEPAWHLPRAGRSARPGHAAPGGGHAGPGGENTASEGGRWVPGRSVPGRWVPGRDGPEESGPGEPEPDGQELGVTFDGRDVFGPVAAHLCRGVDLAELGTTLDPAEVVGGPLVLASGPSEEVAGMGLDVEVLAVDRYGNAQLGLRPATIAVLGSPVMVAGAVRSVRVGGADAASTVNAASLAVRVRGYGDLAPGQLGLIADSVGLVALCLDRASAADSLGLRPGSVVHLASAPVPMSVQKLTRNA